MPGKLFIPGGRFSGQGAPDGRRGNVAPAVQSVLTGLNVLRTQLQLLLNFSNDAGTAGVDAEVLEGQLEVGDVGTHLALENLLQCPHPIYFIGPDCVAQSISRVTIICAKVDGLWTCTSKVVDSFWKWVGGWVHLPANEVDEEQQLLGHWQHQGPQGGDVGFQAAARNGHEVPRQMHPHLRHPATAPRTKCTTSGLGAVGRPGESISILPSKLSHSIIQLEVNSLCTLGHVAHWEGKRSSRLLCLPTITDAVPQDSFDDHDITDSLVVLCAGSMLGLTGTQGKGQGVPHLALGILPLHHTSVVGIGGPHVRAHRMQQLVLRVPPRAASAAGLKCGPAACFRFH